MNGGAIMQRIFVKFKNIARLGQRSNGDAVDELAKPWQYLTLSSVDSNRAQFKKTPAVGIRSQDLTDSLIVCQLIRFRISLVL